MGAKRALIVDDSLSARTFLSRILEKYEIEVDTVESAEQAIEYLTSNRPDVIFMDHLMPGMDGFQAVQAIKSNPQTATIPIMMYTSQEGELYLGQARALGAVGVLPKQIKPADVSKVLYQLHLVPDRRTSEQTTFRPVGVEDSGEPHAAAVRPLTEAALREQFAELRRAMMATLDSQSERFVADMRAMLLEALPPPPPAEPARPARPWGWIAVSCVALALAIAGTGMWWREFNLRRGLEAELVQAREAAERAPSPEAAPVTSAAADAADESPTVPEGATAESEAMQPIIEAVPYGVDPLGGERLETVRRLLTRLAEEGRTGVVEVRTFAGRFCLVGNATEGFSLAPDETPYSRCDVVGNPHDEGLLPAQRIPLAVANLAGDLRTRTQGALDVRVEVGDADSILEAYPPVTEHLTAGEWNRAARANNRVEIRLR